MVRTVDNYFMGPNCRHDIAVRCFAAIRGALDCNGGEFVWESPDCPPRGIGFPSQGSPGQNFGWSFILIAITEYTVIMFQMMALKVKIMRPLASLGGDDYPGPGNRVLPQFRQNSTYPYKPGNFII
jgi:hypothetical protein